MTFGRASQLDLHLAAGTAGQHGLRRLQDGGLAQHMRQVAVLDLGAEQGAGGAVGSQDLPAGADMEQRVRDVVEQPELALGQPGAVAAA